MQVTGARVVFTAPGCASVEEFAVSEPSECEVLIRTERSAVSAGTEMSNLLGQLSAFRGYPCYPGYANVGRVVAVGARVAQPAIGQRVLTMGSHASHVLLDLSPARPGGPQYWEPVPDAVAPEAAAFAILGSVALHGVRRAGLQIGESVVVIGQGMVGQLIGQFARWSGCQPVIAMDLYPERLAQAARSGADATIAASAVDPVAEVGRVTGGRGADVVFEATRSSRTIPTAMRLAGSAGRVMVVGSLPNSIEIDPFTELQLKELSLVGCFQPAAPILPHQYYPWTQSRNRQVFLAMVAAGKLSVEHLITHRLPYGEAAQAYAMMQKGGGDWLGIVLDWDDRH